MPSTTVLQFTGKRCTPVFLKGAKQIPVTLRPGTYQAGQLVGYTTAANVNDVQTITVDSCTHSTLTLNNLPDGSSYTAVQDVTPAALTTALQARFGAGSVVVTGTYVAGSGGTYIFTWGGPYAGRAIPVMTTTGTTFVGGSSPAAVNVHTTTGVGPNGAYSSYTDANSDGTGVAVGILEYGCYVDYTGAVWIGNVTGPVSEFGQSELSAPMWYQGDFDIADLVGLDAAAQTDLHANVILGSISSAKGVLHIG